MTRDWAVCGCDYQPRLTNGRLVKKYDAAWQLPEEVRSGNDSLRQIVRIRAVDVYGLGHHHASDSRKSERGYPDLDLWSKRPGGGSIYRELKRMGKDPTAAQISVLTEMARAGRDVGVWRPCCWYCGRIDRELAALARREPVGQYAPGASLAAPSSKPAASPAPAVRPVPSPVAISLPGAAPVVLTGGVGYVVPATAAATADMDHLRAFQAWLRECGFPPTMTPFPIRLIISDTGTGQVLTVHVRVELATRANQFNPPRLWRTATLTHPFPAHLVDALGMVVVRPAAGVDVMTAVESTLAAPMEEAR